MSMLPKDKSAKTNQCRTYDTWFIWPQKPSLRSLRAPTSPRCPKQPHPGLPNTCSLPAGPGAWIEPELPRRQPCLRSPGLLPGGPRRPDLPSPCVTVPRPWQCPHPGSAGVLWGCPLFGGAMPCLGCSHSLASLAEKLPDASVQSFLCVAELM